MTEVNICNVNNSAIIEKYCTSDQDTPTSHLNVSNLGSGASQDYFKVDESVIKSEPTLNESKLHINNYSESAKNEEVFTDNKNAIPNNLDTSYSACDSYNFLKDKENILENPNLFELKEKELNTDIKNVDSKSVVQVTNISSALLDLHVNSSKILKTENLPLKTTVLTDIKNRIVKTEDIKESMPAVFQQALVWPPEIKQKKNKLQKKISSALTSEEWQKHHLQIENKKLRKKGKKEERKRKREELKIKKTNEINAKKSLAERKRQEKKRIDEEINKLLAQKKIINAIKEEKV